MNSNKTIDIIILDVDRWFFNEKTKEDMNHHASQNGLNICYDDPHIGGPSLLSYEGLIYIGIPLLQELLKSGMCDIIRYALLQIWERIKPRPNAPESKPTLFIKSNEIEIELDFKFDLDEDQKNKVIDASIDTLKSLTNKEQN